MSVIGNGFLSRPAQNTGMKHLIALSVGLFLVGWPTAHSQAATLVETSVGGVSVWLVDDPRNERVLIASHGGSKLIDLRSRIVYMIAPDGTAQKVHVDAFRKVRAEVPPFEIEKLGPGPRVAEYATTRFRLSVGGQTCSVIDANLSLMEPLKHAMRAVELLDLIDTALQGENRPLCERIPFREYARIGWGLRVADSDSPVIETIAVIRDYAPNPEELALPLVATDMTDLLKNGGVGGQRRDP